MAVGFKVGQVVFDKLNNAYVRIVYLFHDDVQVDWFLEKEIASYHLPYKDVVKLSKRERGD